MDGCFQDFKLTELSNYVSNYDQLEVIGVCLYEKVNYVGVHS